MEVEELVELICYLLPVLGSVLGCIITFVRTGKIKNIDKEIRDMKYRTLDYREKEKPEGTSFAYEVPQYRLNKQTNRLVELPVKKNLQESLNSFRDVALTEVIERYMPVDTTQESPVLDAYGYNSDRLDVLLTACDYADELRSKYGYTDEMSLLDMINDLQAKNEEIIKNINKAKITEVIKDESKEIVEEK